MSFAGRSPTVYRVSKSWTAVIALSLAAIAATTATALQVMYWTWLGSPEFSHAPLIPLVAAFLVWQQKDELQAMPFSTSWLGVALALFGALLAIAGKLSSLFTLSQYGAVFAFQGIVLAAVGIQVFRRLWAPMFILLLMVPLPDFILNNFSAEMQLLSSRIGVWFMRLFGVSVYLAGNVIDLGVYQLQVAEACDGLRYLFPLMTLGFIIACFFKAAMWKRVFLFLSSIPITILMNSLRVGTIGVMVEHWGIGMAEGFLHEFQGWAVFMLSAGLMLLEMVLLARIGKDGRHWRELFGLEFPARTPKDASFLQRTAPASLIVVCGSMLLVAGASLAIPERAEVIPLRRSFVDFPLEVGGWRGRRTALEKVYLDQLKLDDYLLGDFQSSAGVPVNLYVAWYNSQQAGRSAHSPRSCLPGGGWQMKSLVQVPVDGVVVGGQPLEVNRALIQMGSQRQLVYYWFQQRGRVVTNEYAVKWYLFWDSLTRNRSDGALLRVTTPVLPNEEETSADLRLRALTRAMVSPLEAFVPG